MSFKHIFFFCLKDQRLWRFCKCVQKCNFGTELYYQLSPFYHDFAQWCQRFFEVGLDIFTVVKIIKFDFFSNISHQMMI